ncbi:sushi, nidogen and EGF-like domain-containing protein 1 [Branchiostoma floridae]|uniref:Sushi, nidogen and EGF-like domain-containing protein 1 n=1 Tax=Branchiostoma floridae TaxID=7739 RepID=A0A9J7LJG5_BRAFL|nr:sushi, nidogen and EGF-like domain-containing protein 1 [Branchiostoma floridae]
MRQFILTTCLLASLAVRQTSAEVNRSPPVSNAAFYPYGPGTADILDSPADDSSSGEQSLSIAFPFFEETYNSLWVNTNGDISFGGSVTGFTPIPFPVEDNKLIAGYFTDIKTSYDGRSGYIYHRETTDATVLSRATTDIQTAFPAEHGSFVAIWAYIATWHEVAFFGSSGASRNLRNTFQLVLITDGCKSFCLFNYDRIDFLQGSTNGGDSETGTGPNPAQVGVNGGDGIHYTPHPYSTSTDLYNLPTWTDPAVPGPPGRWYRRVDRKIIGDTPQGCPPSYEFYGDKCVKLQEHPLDYAAAISKCEAEGARLFNIRSQADNEWLTDQLHLFVSGKLYQRGFWIGLTDEDTEGTFVWEDGTTLCPTSYTNWAGDALASNDGTRNCVYISRGYNGKWSIKGCDDKKKSICVTDAEIPTCP